MTQEIEAGFDTLVLQAGKTANSYMADAVEAIDERFGKGYAEKNPALVAAFMRAASADFGQAMLKLAAQDVRNGIQELANAILARA
jgi:hypothetical protein